MATITALKTVTADGVYAGSEFTTSVVTLTAVQDYTAATPIVIPYTGAGTPVAASSSDVVVAVTGTGARTLATTDYTVSLNTGTSHLTVTVDPDVFSAADLTSGVINLHITFYYTQTA